MPTSTTPIRIKNNMFISFMSLYKEFVLFKFYPSTNIYFIVLPPFFHTKKYVIFG